MDKNYIQLNDNSLRFYIKDVDGNATGEYLEFNMGELDLLDRYEEMIKEDRANTTYLNNQFKIIEKKEDHKSKGAIATDNEKSKIKAMQEYYRKETETYNKFLGENGVQKLLHGRPLTWTTLGEITDIIEKDIQPKLQLSLKDMQKEIQKKYSNKESETLTDET